MARALNKILAITPDFVTIEIIIGKDIIQKQVARHNVPRFKAARLGLFLRAVEHGIYDVVDEDGNFVTK